MTGGAAKIYAQVVALFRQGVSAHLWSDKVAHVYFEDGCMFVDSVNRPVLQCGWHTAVVYYAAGCHPVSHLPEHLPGRLSTYL